MQLFTLAPGEWKKAPGKKRSCPILFPGISCKLLLLVGVVLFRFEVRIEIDVRLNR